MNPSLSKSSFPPALSYIAAVLLLVWGVFLMLGGLINMFPDDAPPKILPSDIFMMLTLGVAPSVLGVALWLRASRQKRAAAEEALEREILRLAAQSHSKLTATDVAVRIVITVKQAEEALQSMVIKGLAQIQISESGAVVYHFYTLLSHDEKQGATGF
jgi:hypothetical protein